MLFWEIFALLRENSEMLYLVGNMFNLRPDKRNVLEIPNHYNHEIIRSVFLIIFFIGMTNSLNK
jgi:hypothetical protein